MPNRIFVTDFNRNMDPFAQASALAAGDALVFRHYELDRQRRADLGQSLRALCKERRALFIVAGSAPLAIMLRADGLHLPGWALAGGRNWRYSIRPNWLLSAATHNQAELVAAKRAGADLCLLSPVLPTQSHVGGATLGPIRAAKLVAEAGLPVYALGGISQAAQKRLGDIGFRGFAGTDPDQ
ncbi:MAG: thiamine phosphate synthase [Parvibaculum sp.]